jgi:hypothetical protein
MTASDWSVKGDEIRWRGRLWLKSDRPDLHKYAERVAARYPGEAPAILLGAEPTVRTKGGPWRYTLPDGTSDVVHTSTKADAKLVLRHQLKRKRLPKGTAWEIVQ